MNQPSLTRLRCTRRLEFDAAHRVLEHESKCKFLHGHRYALEASFEAEALDALGRVIDFGQIKTILGGWIDEHWDHGTLLNVKDEALGHAIAQETGQKIYYMAGNPTAEKMAEHLFNDICPRLFEGLGVRCTRLRLYETPNCYAEALSSAPVLGDQGLVTDEAWPEPSAL